MALGLSCHQTEITNVSGRTIVASIFGKTLTAGEVFTVPGDVWAWLVGKFPGIKGRRMIEKFRSLIEDGIFSVTGIPSSPCGEVWNSSSSTFVAP